MRPQLRAVAAAVVLVTAVAALPISRRAQAAASDLVQAPERLEDTGLYLDGRIGVVDPRNQAFSPQYPLWSDGASKARWVYLPPGATIDVTDVGRWDFPIGTKFWKEFAFNGRRVETRLLWKASATRWVTASYMWNDAGTEAVRAPAAGVRGVAEVAPGKQHAIPSATDCLACHGTKQTGPLGFNALQLSTDRDPLAIHGEPIAPGMVTLKTLADDGRFAPARPELVATPPRIRTESPRTRAVLGYLSTNCGSCHNGTDEISVRGLSLAHRDVMADGDAVARQLAEHRTAWQVPGTLEGESVFANPGEPDQSALLVRMKSRRPSSQMPPLGTVVRDQAAVDAVRAWLALDLPHTSRGTAVPRR